jgi:serine/threonine-protein kinase
MPFEQLGRYEIAGKLGQGAMGVVYKARDPLIDRTVAIKTVALAGLSREESGAFEQRFYREAKSAGRLNHPNIVTVYDVGRSGDLAYIAMEFLEGQSLREVLDSGVVLTIDRVSDIAAQVADGLAFAHKNDVVHRDIKPANVMVLLNGAVKITDFGVALLPSGALTVAGTAFGSPKYMSPEQVVGRQVDGRADIFSLGAVLYEMLTGLPPFAGDDLNATLYQVINEMPDAPSSRNRNIPPAFDYIVARAMAKHPDDRYQSVQEMASDLRNYRQLGQLQSDTVASRSLERRVRPRMGGDDTVPLAALPADALPERASRMAAEATPGDAMRSRKLLFYGVPAALLAALAGWALLRQPASNREAIREKAAASAPETPRAAIGEGGSVEQKKPAEAAPAPVPQSSSSIARASAPAAKSTGRVTFAVTPWGEVYVNGEKRGISPPMTEIKLAQGKHAVEIRNADFPPYRETVVIGPDTNLRIKHKFQ